MTNPAQRFIQSSTSTKLYGLDHLRAFAIILVFAYHYGHIFPAPEWLYNAGKFGWTGVDLFFVLSGYLISSQLFAGIAKGKTISFQTFFLKRFFRIIPAYLAVVALYFCFPLLREREAPAPLWRYLSFTQNFGLDLRTHGTFSHAWSLCIEEQFYLLLPLTLSALVLLKKFRRGAWLLATLFVLGFFARWYMYNTHVVPILDQPGAGAIWYKWIYYPTYSRLDGLLSGVAIAALFQFRPNLKERLNAYGNFFLLLGVLILIGAYLVCISEESFDASVFGFFLVSIAYGAVVLGAVSRGSFLYKSSSAFTSRIAALSYAIYLTHKIIIHVTQQQLSKLNIDKDGNRMLVLCILTSFAGAWVLNRAIEKPFLRLRDRLLNKKPRPENDTATIAAAAQKDTA
jgi:peptidoglycan/LPS O-acetylase OafA/YrhL